MISTLGSIKRKTKAGDLGREQYLYSTMAAYDASTTSEGMISFPGLAEDKTKCLVHLANFAYDPVNYDFFEHVSFSETKGS